MAERGSVRGARDMEGSFVTHARREPRDEREPTVPVPCRAVVEPAGSKTLATLAASVRRTSSKNTWRTRGLFLVISKN